MSGHRGNLQSKREDRNRVKIGKCQERLTGDLDGGRPT